MKYSLKRSKRKTLAIHILQNGEIEVRAPIKLSKTYIEKFLDSKENLIKYKQEIIIKNYHNKQQFSLNYGDRISLRGEKIKLIACTENKIFYNNYNLFIPEKLDSKAIKSACIKFYKDIAKQVLIEKTQFYAKMMNVCPTSVKINSAKTRWGSCSAEKRINYSWKLIMAEDKVIDYVVVHELAHIIQMNHSEKFWTIVKQILPDYKERLQTLKTFQKQLSGQDWE